MNKAVVLSKIETVTSACEQLQELLARWGIVSTLCGTDGSSLDAGWCQRVREQALCKQADECLHQAFRQWQERSSDKDQLWEGKCPAGYIMVIVPLRQRRRQMGYMLCCMKKLRYKKTESLERICNQWGIDSTVLIEQGLGDALDGAKLAGILSTLWESMLAKMQQGIERTAELEALSASLARSYEELALLHRISDRLKVTQEPQEFFTDLCQNLKEVVEADKLVVLWSEREEPFSAFNVAASAGEIKLSEADLDLLWQRTKRSAREDGDVLIDSNVDGPYRHKWPEPIRNLAGAPIRRGEKFVGVLAALNKINKADFDSTDTKLLSSVANESAVYLDNLQLYREMRDLMLGVLRALTSSIDAKDPYTCGHSERVAIISRWLASELSLDTEQINNMYLGGLLHDVGKIGVSESVLCKPGVLAKEEFEQICRHPQIGANILGGIRQMFEVAPAVLTHHEQYDGSGYPQGLKGKNIPLAGRIVMLADSFDAMTSDRTYRRALPLATALAEVRRFSGTQFDPALAEIFLRSDREELIHQLAEIKAEQQISLPRYGRNMN